MATMTCDCGREMRELPRSTRCRDLVATGLLVLLNASSLVPDLNGLLACEEEGAVP